jgi:hypothetical protein
VEIKSAQTVSGDILDGLLCWTSFTGQSPETTTLIHGGEASYPRHGRLSGRGSEFSARLMEIDLGVNREHCFTRFS